MTIRSFALLMGAIFAIVGIAGFIPAFVTDPPIRPDAELLVTGAHGLLFGLFPVNWVHNLIHLAFGLWGIAAWKGMAGGARTYLKSVAVIYAVLFVMGFIPVLNTTFGLAPLYGHDIWLHALLAIAAGYFGFMHKEAPTGTVSNAPRR